MKNAALFLTFVVSLVCGHLYSCSSGTTQTGNESSSSADNDTADVQLAEPDFNDFLNCFEKCRLPYPDNFRDVSENEIPEALFRAYIFKNDSAIGHNSSSGILLSTGRISLHGNKTGVIFSESNPDHTEKSVYLFIYDSDGTFMSSYMLDRIYRGAETREYYSSVISENYHIMTTLINERRDMISDEWTVSEESFHYMISDEGLIVDSSYE